MIELPAADRPKAAEPEGGTRRRICIAAMKTFADHGSEAASMRMVAAAADVSVGLVQHHFGTKAALVAAVDDELFAIIEQAAPLPIPAKDPVADTSHRLTSLIAEHPDAVNYLSRLLAVDEPTGRKIFDMLLGISHAHWDHLRDQGGARPDLNPAWSALNPLILVLGTLILRRHIERQLPEPLASPTQLQTWETAMDNLIGRGQLR